METFPPKKFNSFTWIFHMRIDQRETREYTEHIFSLIYAPSNVQCATERIWVGVRVSLTSHTYNSSVCQRSAYRASITIVSLIKIVQSSMDFLFTSEMTLFY